VSSDPVPLLNEQHRDSIAVCFVVIKALSVASVCFFEILGIQNYSG